MTTQLAPLQSSLAAGELSEELDAREDVEAYFQGAAALPNMIVEVTGGADKRGGFEDLGKVARRARLIPFIRSRTDREMLEFSNFTCRIIDGATGAPVLIGGAEIVLDTPWSETELDGIYAEQINDVVFLTHLSRATPPQVLKRFPGDNWRLDPWGLVYGPFLPTPLTDVTIRPSAQSGVAVLSASAPLFDAAHVGTRWELRAPTGWHSGEIHREKLVVTLGQEVVSDGKVYRSEGDGECGGNQPIHDLGTASDGKIGFTYLHDGAAIVNLTAVTAPGTATATVEGYVPSLGATSLWREPAFSGLRGWPGIVFLYEERIGLCSTKAQPDTVHLSAVADYSPDSVSFKPGSGFAVVTDSDGVSRTLAGGQTTEILWAVSDERLFLGTDGGIKRVSGPSLDEPITPNPGGAVARPVSTDGANSARPAVLQNAIIFAAADGGRVLDMFMDRDRDEPRDLTARATHVGASPIVEFAAIRIGDKHIFARREDGLLYQLTYDRRENVAGFARQPVGGGGLVESIASLPDAKKRDQLWAIVNWNGDRRRVRLHRKWNAATDLPDEQRYLDRFREMSRWNKSVKKVTAFGAEPGATGELKASAPVFAMADIGKEFWLRAPKPSSGDPKSYAIARYEITGFTSSRRVNARLLTARPGWSAAETAHFAFPATQFQIPDAVPGETLSLLADGLWRDDVTVAAGGAITLASPAARVIAGFLYEAYVESMPLAPGTPIGSSRGVLKQVESVTAILRNIVEASVEIVGTGKKEPTRRRGRDALSGVATPPAAFTQKVTPPSLPDAEVKLRIRIKGPYAGGVKAVRAKVTTYES